MWRHRTPCETKKIKLILIGESTSKLPAIFNHGRPSALSISKGPGPGSNFFGPQILLGPRAALGPRLGSLQRAGPRAAALGPGEGRETLIDMFLLDFQQFLVSFLALIWLSPRSKQSSKFWRCMTGDSWCHGRLANKDGNHASNHQCDFQKKKGVSCELESRFIKHPSCWVCVHQYIVSE